MTNDDETTPIDPTRPVDPTHPVDPRRPTTPTDRSVASDPTTPMDRLLDPTLPDAPQARTPAAPRPRRSARFGTIFWGVLLLVFALTMAVTALPWFSVDPVTLLLAACIAAGVLLVVAGVAAVVARPRR